MNSVASLNALMPSSCPAVKPVCIPKPRNTRKRYSPMTAWGYLEYLPPPKAKPRVGTPFDKKRIVSRREITGGVSLTLECGHIVTRTKKHPPKNHTSCGKCG